MEKYIRYKTKLQEKFTVMGPIGHGGFGITYEGWDEEIKRRVAIKEFFPKRYAARGEDGINVVLKDSEYADRFAQGKRQFQEEARRVAALKDIDGVVDIFTFFEENGTAYIVMEYLEGRDLKHILTEDADSRDIEWDRKIILSVLYTLIDVHAAGVLHRDIAPDNVFITDDGEVKLIDFGAARTEAALDPKAEIMLKTGYAPIEQYSRQSVQAPYTDIYAVGALFYRMITGHKPSPANERLAREDPLKSPGDLGFDIPRDIELAVMVALNIRPEYRLQSAAEFMEALGDRDFVPYRNADIPEPETVKKALPVYARAAAAFMALAVLFGAFFGVKAYQSGKEGHDISDVIDRDTIELAAYEGRPVGEVERELSAKGFKNIDIRYQYDDREEDVIIRQSPEARTEIKKSDMGDTTLSLVVSGGENKFTMPDCRKLKAKAVTDDFNEMNFDVSVKKDPYSKPEIRKGREGRYRKKKDKVRVNYVFSDKVKKGAFISQSVKAGVLYPGSEEVVFEYSLGPEKDYIKKMPDLTDLNAKKAKKALEKSGLDGVLKVEGDKLNGPGATDTALISEQTIAAGEKINILKDRGRKLDFSLDEPPDEDDSEDDSDDEEDSRDYSEREYSGYSRRSYYEPEPSYTPDPEPEPAPEPEGAPDSGSQEVVDEGLLW